MAKNQYAQYALKDFTRFDCLKLSVGIHAILLFVLRGYIIWIMSISNMKNQTATIQMVFPDPKLFYLSLVSGAVGVFIVLIITLRRPGAAHWIKYCWQHIRGLLLLALTVDVIVSLVGCFYLSVLPFSWLLVQLTLSALFIMMLFCSKKIKLNSLEFPEQLTD